MKTKSSAFDFDFDWRLWVCQWIKRNHKRLLVLLELIFELLIAQISTKSFVNQLIIYHSLVTVYRIRQSRTPEYLATIFRKENLRGKVVLPKPNLELAEKSFSIRGARLWDLLPDQLREESKLSSFKISLRKWILENTPKFLD